MKKRAGVLPKEKMQTIFRQIRSANEEIKYVNVMNDTYNVY